MSGRRFAGPLVQLASVVLVIGVWEVVSLALANNVLPGPWHVGGVVKSMLGDGSFAQPLGGSLLRTLGGFAGAMVLGIGYGIAAARSRRFEESTSSVFNVLLFAPTLVLVFAGLLALGFSSSWVVILITSVAVFPNAGVYMRDVMRHVDTDLINMSKSFHVTTARRIRDLYIPYLTPPLLSSSRIALNSSWKAVLLCEVFGFPGGLGFNIRNAYGAYNIPVLLAWVVFFVATLLIIEQVIRAGERLVVRWT
jgi:ABC-type nitrate/sulfonate/bicarbonate transport system permease component